MKKRLTKRISGISSAERRHHLPADTKTIILDLDGTLYVSSDVAREIRLSASRYIASMRGVDREQAWFLIEDTKKRISAGSGREATLTAACLELGGDLRALHRHFASEINPARYLTRDRELVNVLEGLAGRFEFYIYTNNNRCLCDEIMKALGVSPFFRGVFTIEDFWRPKPDLSVLEQIFARVGRKAPECLFVGDRYDVDLRLPALMGSRVALVKCSQELVKLLKELTKEEFVQSA
jgi:putative hydrolase of the HAD superfamily